MQDFYCYDSTSSEWTLLSPGGTSPFPRNSMLFGAVPNGTSYRLSLFGGYDGGERCNFRPWARSAVLA